LKPLDIIPHTLVQNPISRPLQRFNLYLIWIHIKLIEECDQGSFPVDFEPVKNILQSKQIALIHIYNEETISKKNAPEKAAKYFRKMKTSGHELYCDYIELMHATNRREDPGKLSILKINIKRIKSIVQYLNEKGKKAAYDDLESLEKHTKKYYNKTK
jgi:hypothetical protein